MHLNYLNKSNSITTNATIKFDKWRSDNTSDFHIRMYVSSNSWSGNDDISIFKYPPSTTNAFSRTCENMYVCIEFTFKIIISRLDISTVIIWTILLGRLIGIDSKSTVQFCAMDHI